MKRLTLIAFALVLAASVAPAHASTTSPDITGTLWEPSQATTTSSCAADTLPVGLQVSSTDGFTNHASMICRDASGATVVDSPGGSGTVEDLMCPDGTVLVGLRGRAGDVVDALGVRCGDGTATVDGPISSGTGGDPVGPFDCANLMTSITTWSRAWIVVDGREVLSAADKTCAPFTLGLVAHPTKVIDLDNLLAAVPLSATATNTDTGGPAAGIPVTFTVESLLGTYTCIDTTDASGNAGCTVDIPRAALTLLPPTYVAKVAATPDHTAAQAKGTISLL